MEYGEHRNKKGELAMPALLRSEPGHARYMDAGVIARCDNPVCGRLIMGTELLVVRKWSKRTDGIKFLSPHAADCICWDCSSAEREAKNAGKKAKSAASVDRKEKPLTKKKALLLIPKLRKKLAKYKEKKQTQKVVARTAELRELLKSAKEVANA